MPFVRSVHSVQCVDKRVDTAAAGVDMDNSQSLRGHITLPGLLTRGKSQGALKPEQEIVCTNT